MCEEVFYPLACQTDCELVTFLLECLTDQRRPIFSSLAPTAASSFFDKILTLDIVPRARREIGRFASSFDWRSRSLDLEKSKMSPLCHAAGITLRNVFDRFFSLRESKYVRKECLWCLFGSIYDSLVLRLSLIRSKKRCGTFWLCSTHANDWIWFQANFGKTINNRLGSRDHHLSWICLDIPIKLSSIKLSSIKCRWIITRKVTICGFGATLTSCN